MSHYDRLVKLIEKLPAVQPREVPGYGETVNSFETPSRGMPKLPDLVSHHVFPARPEENYFYVQVIDTSFQLRVVRTPGCHRQPVETDWMGRTPRHTFLPSEKECQDELEAFLTHHGV